MIKPRYVIIIVTSIYLAVFLLISFRIISYGFMPLDDAMRHVAKAVSGKDWSEILVLKPEIMMDSHTGWHLILSYIYKITNSSPDNLIVFSVISLFLFFCLVPIFFLK